MIRFKIFYITFWETSASNKVWQWHWSIIRWKFPFTIDTHKPARFVCWEESIMHNAEQTSHLAQAIVAEEMLYLPQASARPHNNRRQRRIMAFGTPTNGLGALEISLLLYYSLTCNGLGALSCPFKMKMGAFNFKILISRPGQCVMC